MDGGRLEQLTIITTGMIALRKAMIKVDETKLTEGDKQMFDLINEVVTSWGVHLTAYIIEKTFGVKK